MAQNFIKQKSHDLSNLCTTSQSWGKKMYIIKISENRYFEMTQKSINTKHGLQYQKENETALL